MQESMESKEVEYNFQTSRCKKGNEENIIIQ